MWTATHESHAGWREICIFIMSVIWTAEPFSHASSASEGILIFYLDYCPVRIGNSSFILPVISAMCRQRRALANIQTACGLNALVEDSQHCSAVQEAGLALIIHEDWFGRFFSLLCWLHACCYEPWSLPTSGSVRKGESANNACGILCDWLNLSFEIKPTLKLKV